MSSSASSSSLRQTRRNTQTFDNPGSHVMDPWKDDRLRDFVAVNVITRVKSFHLPIGEALADAGHANHQRCAGLLMLPRTEACCDGNSLDCPVQRAFCRLFGPSALHHETHAFEKGHFQRGTRSSCSALQLQSMLETPLRRAREISSGREASPAVPEEAMVASMLSLPPARHDPPEPIASDRDDGGGDASTLMKLATSREEEDSPRSASAFTARTAGSATPQDYLTETECHCCNACIDVIVQHYQSMLHKGIIFDRLSQKDMLFAHWVLFRNMDGAPLDAHGSMGRKEALAITIKSGYYNLLKVPKTEDKESTTVLAQTSTGEAPADEASTTVVSAAEGPEGVAPAAAPIAAAEAVVASAGPQVVAQQQQQASASSSLNRKRQRAATTTISIPESTEQESSETEDAPLHPRHRVDLHKDVETKTYATRRATAGEPAPPPPAKSHNAKGADLLPKAVPVRQRNNKVVTTPEAAGAAKREPNDDGSTPVVTVKSSSAPPAAAAAVGAGGSTKPPQQHPTTTTTTTTTSSTTTSAKQDEESGARTTQQRIRSTKDQIAAKNAAARQRDDEAAWKAILGTTEYLSPPEEFSHVSKSSVVILAPFRPRTPQTAIEVRALMKGSGAALEEGPLQHYSFGQQCLLMLAASRLMHPNVHVGDACPSVDPRKATAPWMDYWEEEKKS